MIRRFLKVNSKKNVRWISTHDIASSMTCLIKKLIGPEWSIIFDTIVITKSINGLLFVNGQYENAQIQNQIFLEHILGFSEEFHKKLSFEF